MLCKIKRREKIKILYNGSADLRSPEKEVYFRSWDLANSQMCEVRVATSNICGCNPPNRCGKRSGADFATSSRGFARAGLFGLLVVNITKFSIKTKRDEETFTPALAKPLLYAVLFVFKVLIFAVERWEIYSFF